MRTKLLTFLFMAGIAGCASNPPPPPPMPVTAAAPAPAPTGPVMGRYTGTVDENPNLPRSCTKIRRPVSVTVGRNSMFVLGGIRGTVGPDGTISSRGRISVPSGGLRRGDTDITSSGATAVSSASLSGSATSASMDLMLTRDNCTYHFTLNHA